MCLVPLVDREGTIQLIQAAVVETISKKVNSYPNHQAIRVFGRNKTGFDEIQGEDIDVLIGLSNQSIFPREIRRKNGSYLYSSIFSTGNVAAGNGRTWSVDSKAELMGKRCYLVKAANDFLEAENMGITAPKRCDRCIGCQVCHF